MRVWLARYNRYVYPDIMAIEGDPVYYGTSTTTVTNPSLIVEVRSNSTKEYDRGDEFRDYRSLPDLKEYILIDQYSYHVEQYARTAENQWLLTDYDSEDAVLALSSVEFAISLSELYERVNFEQSEEGEE